MALRKDIMMLEKLLKCLVFLYQGHIDKKAAQLSLILGVSGVKPIFSAGDSS